MEKEQKMQEQSEIERLIQLSKQHGNFTVRNYADSYLQPIFQEKSSTEVVIESLNTIFSFCKK